MAAEIKFGLNLEVNFVSIVVCITEGVSRARVESKGKQYEWQESKKKRLEGIHSKNPGRLVLFIMKRQAILK